jgi:hypothetical protein
LSNKDDVEPADWFPRETEAAVSISLGRLLLALLKIGSIGFGGGMAVIALMEREFVRRRRLLGAEEFVHGVGLGQILGPFAVNTSMFLGYRLYGTLGGLLCAGAFLTPSIAVVIGLSYLYFQYHSIPALQEAVEGLEPVVIALILNPECRLEYWPQGSEVADGRGHRTRLGGCRVGETEHDLGAPGGWGGRIVSR